MAKHEIETQWMGRMQFNSLINGHTIIMDAPGKAGGDDHGPIPKPFVLSALSGCTGMDIVALLRKEGKQVTDLSISVTGELSKQQPIEYVSVHVIYEFKGDAACKEAAIRAVHLSQEKYCGVSHMLRKALPISWEVIFNGSPEFSNKRAEEDTAIR